MEINIDILFGSFERNSDKKRFNLPNSNCLLNLMKIHKEKTILKYFPFPLFLNPKQLKYKLYEMGKHRYINYR